MGEGCYAASLALDTNLIVKLHDRSRDLREPFSGGVDWVARLAPLLPEGRALIAPHSDISPYLVAADVMVTDHSSAGFDSCCSTGRSSGSIVRSCSRRRTSRPDYAELLASVSESVDTAEEVVAAVSRALEHPSARSEVGAASPRTCFTCPAPPPRAPRPLCTSCSNSTPIRPLYRLQEGTCQPSA